MSCGCKKYLNLYIESEITNHSFKRQQSQILFPTLETNFDDLKCQVINEYLDILQALECGDHPDLKILLEEISLIEVDKYDRL